LSRTQNVSEARDCLETLGHDVPAAALRHLEPQAAIKSRVLLLAYNTLHGRLMVPYWEEITYRSKQHPFIVKARNFWGALVLPTELVGHCNDQDTQTEMLWEQGCRSFNHHHRIAYSTRINPFPVSTTPLLSHRTVSLHLFILFMQKDCQFGTTSARSNISRTSPVQPCRIQHLAHEASTAMPCHLAHVSMPSSDPTSCA
jgi:hypothetical protein